MAYLQPLNINSQHCLEVAFQQGLSWFGDVKFNTKLQFSNTALPLVYIFSVIVFLLDFTQNVYKFTFAAECSTVSDELSCKPGKSHQTQKYRGEILHMILHLSLVDLRLLCSLTQQVHCTTTELSLVMLNLRGQLSCIHSNNYNLQSALAWDRTGQRQRACPRSKLSYFQKYKTQTLGNAYPAQQILKNKGV